MLKQAKYQGGKQGLREIFRKQNGQGLEIWARPAFTAVNEPRQAPLSKCCNGKPDVGNLIATVAGLSMEVATFCCLAFLLNEAAVGSGFCAILAHKAKPSSSD